MCSWILREWKDIFQPATATQEENQEEKENLENKQIEQKTEIEMSSENESMSIGVIIYVWEKIMHTTMMQYGTLRPPAPPMKYPQ